MPQDQRLEQNAQTLLGARGGRMPEEMLRILGIVRDAGGEAVQNLYNWLMPEDATDLGAELAPWGKAIGLIPPKYIQPFVKRLREMIEQEKRWRPEVQQAAWEAVDRYPRIAAHIDEIRPIRASDKDVQANVLGDYVGMYKIDREILSEYSPSDLNKFLDRQLYYGDGPGLGARIRLSPHKATYGSIFEPPSSVAAHEMTHAAQDLWNPDALGPGKRYQTYDYNVNPFELGANASADSMGGNYFRRLERQLNSQGMIEALGTPERAKALNDMNRTLANQGRRIVLDPKSRMLKIILEK